MYPLIFWVVFFAIFYFILIRPQREREKKHREFINNLKKGMKVITEGGFLGTIAEVKEKTVLIKFADNVVLEVLKDSVVAKQPKE
ncbi:MAG TPA: preprotein translocase subunit YajC [bacterium]|nr:preprotein translocase subunit YajC [bacterium]